MRILVVGSGGREHAIVWKLSEGGSRHELYCAPGNVGTARLPNCTNVPAATAAEIVLACRDRGIELVIVGPEMPLVHGLADAVRETGIPCLGPSRAAAALEGSKVMAKQFMMRHGIPTPAWRLAESPQEALSAVDALGERVVIKADGLAAGKGVVVCSSRSEAEQAVSSFMEARSLGPAGERLVVEERLEGFEATVLALTDGESVYELPASQDHKPVGEGNTGPNTGGMGVVCPHPRFDSATQERFTREILEPTIDGIRRDGLQYHGVLYFGLMVTRAGVFVLEYNVRLGDPEAQAVLPLLDADLAELSFAAATGGLARVAGKKHDLASCVVVASSGGYPGGYETGFPIEGIEHCESPVFFAGVAENEAGRPVTAGGRVLAVCGFGRSPAEARTTAYRDIARISFEGMHYRRDIGEDASHSATER